MENPGPPPLLRTCPSCNSRIEPEHAFCEICGAKMPELPACSNCGARFIAPVKFCELCGTPVKPQEVPVTVQDTKMEPVRKSQTPLPARPVVWEEITTQSPTAPELPPHQIKPSVIPDKKMEPVREPDTPQPVQPAVQKEIAPPVPELPPHLVQPEEKKTIADPEPGPDLSATADDALFFIPGDTVPAKPPANRTRVIGGIVLFVLILAAIAFLALPIITGNGGAGGISKPAAAAITPSPEPTPLATPPSPTATPVPTTAFGPLVPQPTQSLPGGQKVYFQVQKDPVSGEISVRYEGSTVANSVSSADVTVTQPGGARSTSIILPQKGVTEISLSGSRGVSDRVEILAKMTNGQTYRVYDAMVR